MVKKMQVIGSRFRVLIGVVVAIMAAIVSAQALRGTGESPESKGRRAAAHRIEVLYAGIPQHGEALGDPGAPVTLQFFADLECPEARHFALGALPFIVRRWVRDGKLRIVYRAYPAETIWPEIFKGQQEAALAAGEQGRLWQYLDFFYHHQGREFTQYAFSPFLEGRAREVRRLDFSGWQVDRYDSDLAGKLRADRRLAHAHGIHETPAFLIGPTGGRAKPLLHFSLLESRVFDEAVEGVLRA
jgi:protein-disulfide isomerase